MSRLAAEIAYERAQRSTDLAVAEGDPDRIAAARSAERHAHAHLVQLVRQEAEGAQRAQLRRLPTGT